MSEEISIYSVVIADDAARMLTQLSTDKGMSQEECMRAVIAFGCYLQTETEQGSKILIQKANGDIREVCFV